MTVSGTTPETGPSGDEGANWVAVVPLNASPARKSRLADALMPPARVAVSEQLFERTLGILGGVPGIARIVVLSPARPEDWNGEWIEDAGAGLNPALEAARAALRGAKLLVVHADLPFLASDDVAALLAAGEGGCAIAPDRHGTGTNALALAADCGLEFAFGPDSFARHRAQAPDAVVVARAGLGFDLDTPEDLAAARAMGLVVDQPGMPPHP